MGSSKGKFVVMCKVNIQILTNAARWVEFRYMKIQHSLSPLGRFIAMSSLEAFCKGRDRFNDNSVFHLTIRVKGK